MVVFVVHTSHVLNPYLFGASIRDECENIYVDRLTCRPFENIWMCFACVLSGLGVLRTDSDFNLSKWLDPFS